MPRIGKWLGKIGAARERHLARHRPTGFGFALADRIDYLDGSLWDDVVRDDGFFLGRPYLRALEEHAPENLVPRYALVFRGRKPAAAVVVQLVRVKAAQFVDRKKKSPLGGIRARLLVCGNLLSWGRHGVAFARGEVPADVWPGIAEAIYRIRRAERLSGQTDFVLVKDLDSADALGARALARFSYRPLETEPNMVLELPEKWRTHDDYLASLNAKYRRAVRQVLAEIDRAGCRVEALTDLDAHADRLHRLYVEIVEGARVRPVTVPPGYMPAVARAAGRGFRCVVVRQGDALLGFVTLVADRDGAVGYYLGVDRAANAELPIYHRLLHAIVAEAIDMRVRWLSLGRTALDAKARLGAQPKETHVWLRHRLPAANALVRSFLWAIPHDEAPERSPFKP
jgi:GNAT acetyltransferase-like protein